MTTGIELDKASDAERLDFDRMVRHLVAHSIRSVRGEGDAWEEVTLTLEDLDELELPPDDLRALELIARRLATPTTITAASRLGLVGEHGLAAAVMAATTSEEAAATVTGWSSFRGQPASPDAGPGGGAVRPEPGDDVPGPA